MAKGTRRKKGRRRGATARANAELGAHLESLGLAAIEAYKAWCRQHGFSAALSKTWQERRQERVAHQRDQRATQATQALQQHIEQPGLDGVAAYQAWCRQQGLGDAIYKSTTQRNNGEVAWDGRDHSGHVVASGVYFYRLETEGVELTRKLLFLR